MAVLRKGRTRWDGILSLDKYPSKRTWSEARVVGDTLGGEVPIARMVTEMFARASQQDTMHNVDGTKKKTHAKMCAYMCLWL